MFLLYTLLSYLILAPYYLVRQPRRLADLAALRQRLGRLPAPLQQTAPGAIWLHAVSVGEVLSCHGLVTELRRRFPGVKLFVSTTTETGQRMAREKLGELADGIFYAPVDFPFAIRRTLNWIRPRLVLIVETEIWPNLFREVKRAGASLLLVNARLSDRSAPRYRRFRFFFGPVLRMADAILAQSALDGERLLAAGASSERVEVGGNLKYDFQPAETPPPREILSLLERSRPRAVWLAGSTREGEEQPVIDAFRQLSEQHHGLLLILAPRHPQRFDSVARLLADSGCNFLRRSRLDPQAVIPLPGALLLDSLGELASLYGLAQAVFVGGSLVDWGGHNVLEPAFAARPVVVGPHMQNFRAITEALLAAGGLVQIPDAADLAPAVAGLFENPEQAAAIGRRARLAAEAQRGAAARVAERAGELYHRAVPNRPASGLRRLALWLPSQVWGAALHWRNRRLVQRRLQTCVVSVGNLTAGGTGKTPVVHWLIDRLRARGLSCAVLTRGYGRQAPEPVTVAEPDSVPPLARTGDEAQLILRHFRIPLGIAADRYRAGCEIEGRFHPDVFLLDDGFQHRQLARDLDLVLVDVTDPFGGGALLPLGRLREPPTALARAGVILLTRCQPGERWTGLEEQIHRHNRDAPILRAFFEPAALIEASTGQEQPCSLVRELPVAAFCGVGNPDSFWSDLERLGARLACRSRYPDHHRYSIAEARDLAAAARRCSAEALVTTEKDWINLGHAGHEAAVSLLAPLKLYWLKMSVRIEGGEQILDRIEQRISKRLARQ